MPRILRILAHPNRLAAFLSSRRGNLVTLAALMAPVLISAAALAVDEGSLYVERRDAQGVTDLAAIAAAADVDHAEKAARATLAANGMMGGSPAGVPAPSSEARPGHYSADPSLSPQQRFQAGVRPYNAVQVTFTKTGQRYFSQAFFAAPKISAHAIATRRARAAFSIGSRLARLDGGLLNAILGGLTGSNVSLKAMDYDALVSTDVDLLEALPALATNLDLDAATYADLLDTALTFPQLVGALAKTPNLSAGARRAAEALSGATRSYGAPKLRLGDLIGADSLAQTPLAARLPGLAVKANLLQLLTAAAAIANGDRQISLDLGAGVPGLLDTSILLAIGEPPQHSPWLAIGSGGEVVRTAQTRLRLVVAISAPGHLLGASIRLPLYLDIAYGEGKLTDISCPTGRPESIKVKIDARPGVADLRIADMDASRLGDFRSPIPLRPARLVSLPLIKVTAAAHAEIGNERFSTLSFDAGDIAANTAKRVSTSDITHSLVGTLLGDLDLNVEIIGIDLGLSSLVKGTLKTVLQSVTPAVDDLLVNLLSMLGVTIGEADLRVDGASCGRPVLVQ